MALESQSVDRDMLKLQKDELVKNLMQHLNKKFLAADKPKKQTDLRKTLINNLKKKK